MNIPLVTDQFCLSIKYFNLNNQFFLCFTLFLCYQMSVSFFATRQHISLYSIHFHANVNYFLIFIRQSWRIVIQRRRHADRLLDTDNFELRWRQLLPAMLYLVSDALSMLTSGWRLRAQLLSEKHWI